MPRKLKYTKEELEQAVKASRSIRQTALKLGLNPSGGGTYHTLRTKFKEWSIDTSHFEGQAWNKGIFIPRPAKPLAEYMIENSTYGTCHLHRRLLRENIFTHQCSECKRTEWNNKPIPLELDHINGVNNDHRIENLRFLCPNCHAQTDTYCGKNKKKW